MEREREEDPKTCGGEQWKPKPEPWAITGIKYVDGRRLTSTAVQELVSCWFLEYVSNQVASECISSVMARILHISGTAQKG